VNFIPRESHYQTAHSMGVNPSARPANRRARRRKRGFNGALDRSGAWPPSLAENVADILASTRCRRPAFSQARHDCFIGLTFCAGGGLLAIGQTQKKLKQWK
jgi:hypothetical protein